MTDKEVSKSKLGVLLKSLSKKEYNSFINYLDSSLFNKKKEIYEAAKFLFKFHPSFEHKNLSKDTLKKHIDKSTKKLNNINLLMNSLLRHGEEFLVHNHVSESQGLKDLILLSEFNNRSIKKGFENHVKSSDHRIEKIAVQSFDQILNSFLIEHEIDVAFSKDQSLPFDQAIISKTTQLDVFFFYCKLKTYCEIISRSQFLKVEYPTDNFEKTLEWLKNFPELIKNPSIKIYFGLIQLLKNFENDEIYSQYIIILKEEYNNFNKDECINLFQTVSNHCIRRINNGSSYYLKELFNIYEFQAEKDLLVKEGFLHDRTVKNIIEVSIRAKKYQWAKNFLNQHIDFVDKEQKEMIYNYNFANINFGMNDLKTAKKHLVFVNIKDPFYQLSYRILLIKIYYSLNDTEAISTSISNFKAFFNREKNISDIQKTIFSNLLFFINKLVLLKEKKNDLESKKFVLKKEELKEQINNETKIADREWLLNEFEKT
jgi:hypothetical protein